MQDNTKETVKASLSLSARNPPVTSGFHTQGAAVDIIYMSSHHTMEVLDWIKHLHLMVPVGCQVIVWTSAGWLLICPIGTNVSKISIQINLFFKKKIDSKMSLAKWWPFFVPPHTPVTPSKPTQNRQKNTKSIMNRPAIGHRQCCWRHCKTSRVHVGVISGKIRYGIARFETDR